MYQLPQTIIQHYQIFKEQLGMTKMLWYWIFEEKIRETRFYPPQNFGETNWDYLKRRDEIYNASFSDNELKMIRDFERLIELCTSFWTFPDDEDFVQIIKKHDIDGYRYAKHQGFR